MRTVDLVEIHFYNLKRDIHYCSPPRFTDVKTIEKWFRQESYCTTIVFRIHEDEFEEEVLDLISNTFSTSTGQYAYSIRG